MMFLKFVQPTQSDKNTIGVTPSDSYEGKFPVPQFPIIRQRKRERESSFSAFDGEVLWVWHVKGALSERLLTDTPSAFQRPQLPQLRIANGALT